MQSYFISNKQIFAHFVWCGVRACLHALLTVHGLRIDFIVSLFDVRRELSIHSNILLPGKLQAE